MRAENHEQTINCTWPNANIKILQYICLHIGNSTTQILHYNTFHLLRYAHFRYVKCLFTNIQKKKNTLKTSLLFKKCNLYGQITCVTFRIVFLYEHKHGEIFKSASVYL